MNNIKDMNKRVKEIRIKENLKQGDMAKKISIKQSSLSDIENGRVNVSQRVISDLCREFNVNEEWLCTGIGDMYIKPSKEEMVMRSVNKILNGENEFIKNLFVAIGNLPDEQLSVVEKIIHNVTKINDNMASENINKDEVSATEESNPNLIDVSWLPPDIQKNLLKVAEDHINYSDDNTNFDIESIKQTAQNG